MPEPRKSLMRSLGEFVGHIVAGVRADPARERTTVARHTEEAAAQGPDGERITLRRTTIEEIEVRPPE